MEPQHPATPAGDGDPSAAPAWPPRVANPPPLPYAPSAGEDLTLDASALPPEEPDFTPSRLDPVRKEAARRRGRAGVEEADQSPGDDPPKAVIFDPKNPSGRTRGDTVLRPTDADREARIARRRRSAAAQGAAVSAFLILTVGSTAWPTTLQFAAAGAGAGWLAYDYGDSEVSWALALSLAAVVCSAQSGIAAVVLAGPVFMAAGWLVGFTRDAEMGA